ncbi:glycosyltransferase [Haloarchaeobius sp. HRN-SO-5]|uniref:glycosyltransferase n=1 Tax=Haloarchaeobius sp. HRN-SO-5 TaxID=3446118 RepID=UPI003EBF2FCA
MNAVFPPDSYGGAENYVFRVASALQERGHDVCVLTTKPFDGVQSLNLQRQEQDGIAVFRFYPLNISHRSKGTGENVVTKALWHQLDTANIHARKVISKFLTRRKFDVVHTNNFMGISTLVGSAIAKSDARFVHMLHDYSLICPKSNLLRERTLPDDDIDVCKNPPVPCRMYGAAKKRSIGRPDLVVSPSHHVIDVHRQHGFFENVPTKRIQHGVTEIADSPPTGKPNRAVLYVGKHLRAKGLETIFEAAQYLSDVTFHLCGTGPYDDKSKAAAAKLENVEFHGYVSDERLHALRRNVGATIVPSIWMENSPLVVYESFAAGLPVLASSVGGLPELVTDGRGDLFPPDDPEALAGCVQRHLNDDEKMTDRRDNALSWAANHTIEDHVDRLMDCYGSMEN